MLQKLKHAIANLLERIGARLQRGASILRAGGSGEE